jgi:hypothetical protein
MSSCSSPPVSSSPAAPSHLEKCLEAPRQASRLVARLRVNA